jgi:primosomal protein N' (replication factor Y)
MEVGYSGFGTERIEEEIQRLFPDLAVRRVDTDSVRNKQLLKEILNQFHAGKIDILLGTQMVAKGLNFPGVKLVGIISADTGLQLPDFRAAERTFDLIVQVSGRAGRFHPDGKVLVQTFLPDNETIHLAARADLDTFYRKELEVRKALSFPPFTRLIRLVFRARSALKSRSAATGFAQSLPDAAQEESGVEVLGPVECPLSVIAGNHRNHIIFRSNNFRNLHALVRRALQRFQVPAGVYVEVDVDPVSVL